MKQQTLSKLVIACVILLALFFLLSSSEQNGGSAPSVELFSDLKLEQVAKIRIEQGATNIELQLKDGVWTLPSRADYRADYGKVRGLILKLVGLNVSQRITSAEGNFDKLGVSDKQVQAGKGLVKFFDASGKELSGVYLGENRKGKAGGVPISGQYVRRSDQSQVYLVPEAITVVTTLSYWLDSILTNVLPVKVESVQQFDSAEATSPAFTLLRDPKSADEGKPQFVLKEGLMPEQKLKDIATSQIPSGLENLTIQDVVKAGDDSLKDLSFDKRTVYSLTNALRYTVRSAEKGEKSYILLSVDFDPQLAAELKARAEATSAASSSVASSTEVSAVAVSSAAASVAPAVVLSSADEASKLSEQYKNWVYELRKFQGQKFRYAKDALFESASSSSSAAASPTPVAKPASKKK